MTRARRIGAGNPAQPLYYAIVAHARQPVFYRDLGVPDTVDGRFDMIVLHAVLVFLRLRGDPVAAPLVDDLFDALFADLDRSLREMGLGDMRVGKRVRQMARGFYGRAQAYDRALAGSEPLEDALRRNLYGTVAPPEDAVAAMAAYVRAASDAVAGRSLADLGAADTGFPVPEGAGVEPGR